MASDTFIVKTWDQRKPLEKKQAAADKATKTAKRKRTELGEAFIEAYHTECLDVFDPQSLIDELESDAKVVALFCVENCTGGMSPLIGSGKTWRKLMIWRLKIFYRESSDCCENTDGGRRVYWCDYRDR